jgi:TatD DNase family protein
MYLIDSHTHIYLPEFDADRDEVMKRAKEAGISEFCLPAIDSTTHDKMIEIEKKYPGSYAMMGLHPCSVNQDYLNEIAIIKGYLQERKFIAIGEIGLDFYWDKTFTDQQYKAFHEQIEIAKKYDLPISIHSRNAIDECIEVVEQYKGLNGVFHCFSGNLEQAERIIATGFLLGIGGVISFKNSGLDKVIEKTGVSHIIFETDSPYLAPVPYRGKRNEPSYIKLIAEKTAAVCQMELEALAELTTRNAKNLFKL